MLRIQKILIPIFIHCIIIIKVLSQAPVAIPPLSVTKHTVILENGRSLAYTATSGYLLLESEEGKAKARIFFTAYVKDNEPDLSKRPVTYTFNGGPGSSSVWLHMGALGPKRILMADDGASLEPPYRIVDNAYTWLEFTDLVFIDPVMTGFSRPAADVDKKEFTGYKEDIESVGQFIHLYTTRYGRWSSPKYLAGESYGTTRAAGLSAHLISRYGMFLNGIALISQITNFQTARFEKGNDLPYILFLPTYAATAWYHQKLDPKYSSLENLLDEVRNFAYGEYNLALTKGDKLSEAEKNTITKKLASYTGLSEAYIHQTRLRIHIHRFVKELRRSEGITVGRLDSRFTSSDYDDAGERFEFDPSYDATIYGPYTTALYDHLKRNLKVDIELPYEILTGRVQPWNYNNVQNQYLNVSEELRQAMIKNPFMKVWISNGYYDLATPFFASEYTMDHMMLPADLKKNISMTYYKAGHMMYIDRKSLVDFTKDARGFYMK